jgi:prolyl-tRNA synthetase
MRGREFAMMDAYSFHADEGDLDREYAAMREVYRRIFDRCGLTHAVVEADTGAIGGKDSHEFMVFADSGEDAIARCPGCGYAANVEKAEVKPAAADAGARGGATPPAEIVPTPGKRTVEEVAAFLGVPPARFIKTLVYRTESGSIMALLRGDLQVNDLKLKRLLGARDLELAEDAEVEKALGVPVGYLGPPRLAGWEGRIVADESIRGLSDAVTGANQIDAHLVHVEPGRDFALPELADIRLAREGDECGRCGKMLEFMRGIEVGHIFKLGTRYSESLRATFLDAEGAERTIIMGTYGIGIGRTAAAAAAAARIAKEIEAAGQEVLLDDRDERAGVKFADADLIGAPVRVIVGKRSLAGGKVEIGRRGSEEKTPVPVAEAAARAVALIPAPPSAEEA